MDRAKAKSMTRTVQTVAGVFVLFAVAAAFIPMSVKAESTDASAAPPSPPKPPEPAAPKVEIDTALLATALNSVSGPVKNQPPEAVPTEPGDVPPPVLTGLDAWRYLGAIMSSTYKRAIVVVNDQQHLLAEGQKFNPDNNNNPAGDVEVVQIDKLFIKLKQGEVEKQIDLAPRQRAALVVLDPSGAGRAGAAGAPGGQPGSSRTVGGANNALGGAADANTAASRRQRDLERAKMDAKMRGDEKTAAYYDAAAAELGKDGHDGKLEKSEKGAK